MRRFGALKGGMPLYKFVGNKILTTVQNALLGTRLSEFHSGYRIYSVAALARIPFQLNSERLPLRHRDHHPAAQRRRAHRRAADPHLLRRRDLPRERDEVRQGRDARDAAERRSTAPGCSTSAASIRTPHDNSHYDLKLGYPSSHTYALDAVPRARGPRHRRRPGRHRRASWSRRAATTAVVDQLPPPQADPRREGLRAGSRRAARRFDVARLRYLLLLDVIEHLRRSGAVPRAAARAVRLRRRRR